MGLSALILALVSALQTALLLPVFRQLFRIMLIGPSNSNPERNLAIARDGNAEAEELRVEEHKNEPDKQDIEVL